MKCLIKAVLFFSIASTSLFSSLPDFNFKSTKDSLQLYIGPEIYHVHRTRQGGTKQDGLIYGFRAGYDRIERYKVYWGFDVLHASGTLDGKSGAGNCLKSHFSDTSVEGRTGYTLKSKCGRKPSLTPYVGIGYFVEKNNFSEPENRPIHFCTRYLYASLGFLSQISLCDRLDAGLNFKAKFPYDAKCKVSHDPEEKDSTQAVKEKFHYRIELPMTYHPCVEIDQARISFVPFYELRQYGYHPNYPGDFLETKLHIYGLQVKFMYCL